MEKDLTAQYLYALHREEQPNKLLDWNEASQNVKDKFREEAKPLSLHLQAVANELRANDKIPIMTKWLMLGREMDKLATGR